MVPGLFQDGAQTVVVVVHGGRVLCGGHVTVHHAGLQRAPAVQGDGGDDVGELLGG